MAKHLLKARSNTLCLVISHENLSAGGYIGNERSMLMPLCLFRVSGAAAFLSNRCSSDPPKHAAESVVRNPQTLSYKLYHAPAQCLRTADRCCPGSAVH